MTMNEVREARAKAYSKKCENRRKHREKRLDEMANLSLAFAIGVFFLAALMAAVL